MKNFDVIKLPMWFPSIDKLEHWSFDTAKEVAIFMWGRSIGKYAIYKHGELAFLSHVYSDVSGLEKYLDGDIYNG